MFLTGIHAMFYNQLNVKGTMLDECVVIEKE